MTAATPASPRSYGDPGAAPERAPSSRRGLEFENEVDQSAFLRRERCPARRSLKVGRSARVGDSSWGRSSTRDAHSNTNALAPHNPISYSPPNEEEDRPDPGRRLGCTSDSGRNPPSIRPAVRAGAAIFVLPPRSLPRRQANDVFVTGHPSAPERRPPPGRITPSRRPHCSDAWRDPPVQHPLPAGLPQRSV
jgi:hypothetical protein